ncbi:hypothetical protein ANCCAN_09608 [Ancylostoma caninum]|uniref:Uncharacterized protein n=1 Tax=Ancylostoma caninum TaxID=29170 RepID=A0A368GJ56_ANCCA|nr:hypothetical protein ANCCAN_09608 [Ancylostoma caninum]
MPSQPPMLKGHRTQTPMLLLLKPENCLQNALEVIKIRQVALKSDKLFHYTLGNAAMLEVFYEPLNFETLTEPEAYRVVKMPILVNNSGFGRGYVL